MSQQPSQQPQIELNIDGVPTKVEAGTTGANIYADRKEGGAGKSGGPSLIHNWSRRRRGEGGFSGGARCLKKKKRVEQMWRR